ncbi:hypothetical protein D9615_006194 [Tricholomella constricta]|uniref:Flavin reductase like domain-containing protein n=1 Tax=Tricholomella constricta TaxID=117010 RepID=A0A8H5HBG3_9AGAR|nr:hypothetical protein D9615_006194 [Tricholomella constricta]
MSSNPQFDSSKGFSITGPPNPSWAYGQNVDATPGGREWLEGEKAGWKTVDTAIEDPHKLYGLMISGIVPRPVAFVSTISEDGSTNLAPFSWFNQVSAFPPVISVSCTRSADLTRVKDTVRNIKDTKGFTVNIISEPWVAQANVSSVDAPEGFSEWPISGLTKQPSASPVADAILFIKLRESQIHVKAPRVKESAFSMECELLQAIDIQDPVSSEVTTTLILGSVKYIHVRNDVLNERGGIDPAKFKPVARMGGTLYARINDGYNIERYNWREHEKPIRDSILSKSDL